MMTPGLEIKLAQLVSHLERERFGTGATRTGQDLVGVDHLLNDPEIAAWLDCKRLEGIPPGPMLYKRAY